MFTVDIKTPTAAYSAIIGSGVLQNAGNLLSVQVKGQRAAVVTDENVGPLYVKTLIASLQITGFETFVITLPAGEETKCTEMLIRLYSFFSKCLLTRSDTVLALGGGVIGDLTGFAAGTYLRGVNYIQCPTSLLAMVDSSVGGKTGIDLPEGKNLVGMFYHPRAVIADTDTLTTLPPRQYACGMAEIIKHACIRDAELYSLLDTLSYEQLVARNMEIKRAVVEQDEFEGGLREILNFGHTLGHAVEALGGYSRHTHGEAVAIGMMIAVKIGERLGITPAYIKPLLEQMLTKHGLPIGTDYSPDEMMKFVQKDKKMNNDGVSFVLLTAMGASKRHTIALSDLSVLLENIR